MPTFHIQVVLHVYIMITFTVYHTSAYTAVTVIPQANGECGDIQLPIAQ